MRSLVGLMSVMLWLSGIVIAKGFWSTLFAVIMPLYAWYLVAERMIQRFM
jgi:hypothetical protein